MNAMTVNHSNREWVFPACDSRDSDEESKTPATKHRTGAMQTARVLRPRGVGSVLCLTLLATSMAAAQSQPSSDGASSENEASRSANAAAGLENPVEASQESANSGDHAPGPGANVQIEVVVDPSIAKALQPGKRVDVFLVGRGRERLAGGSPVRIARNVRLTHVASLEEQMVGPGIGATPTRRVTVYVPKDQAAVLTDAQKRGTLHLVLVGEKEEARRALPALTEMLATALKKNPDIRVADAQLQEAEAELSRTRLEVVQKVMTLQNAWQVQQQLIAQATDEVASLQAEMEQFESLYKMGEVPHSQLTLARSRFKQAETERLQAEAQLAQLEASIPYLLGEQAAMATINQRAQARRGMEMMMTEGGMGMMDMAMGFGKAPRTMPADDGQTGKSTTPKAPTYSSEMSGMPGGMMPGGMGMRGGGMNPARARVQEMLTNGGSADAKAISERIRRALGAPTELEFYETPLPEALDFLRELHGINFFVDAAAFQAASPLGGSHPKPDQVQLSIDLRDVPLGAALQAIEDTQGTIRFVVRDYGILVTRKGFEPPNAVSARDFWKGETRGYGMGMPGMMDGMGDYGMEAYPGGAGGAGASPKVGSQPGSASLPGSLGLPGMGGLPGGSQPSNKKK